MYVTKEKNRYSECYKKVLYAGLKSARNILTNLSPSPARLASLRFVANQNDISVEVQSLCQFF